MNKRYLIEQCKRMELVDIDENALFTSTNNEWWKNHNNGHKILLEIFLDYINKKSLLNKNEIKKWLRKRIHMAQEKITTLDLKYDLINNDIEMSIEDSYIYSISDGIICEARTIIEIINKERYISKKAYYQTDWKSIGLIN